MVPEKFLRGLFTAADIAKAKAEKDLDDFILLELNCLRV